MSPQALIRLFLLTMTLLVVPTSARANVVLDLTVSEMVEHSDVVVHGVVRSVETSWDEDHVRIYTNVELDVVRYLSGEGPATVLIRQAGGRVGETELVIPGQPRFTIGEQVVVFLEHEAGGEPNRWVVLCMAAGKFTVSFDATTGELVAGRDLGDVTRIPGPGRRSLLRQPSIRPLLLRELADEVRRSTEARR